MVSQLSTIHCTAHSAQNCPVAFLNGTRMTLGISKRLRGQSSKRNIRVMFPQDTQVLSNISNSELAKHCRRKTRGVEETRSLIQKLLDSMWELTDTTGLRLINHESMARVWEVQQKHLPCIQDPPGVQLYTNIGSKSQKGDKALDVLRCGRGSSSLESFHRHQCSFIPGKLKLNIFETFYLMCC